MSTKQEQIMFACGEISGRLTMAGVLLESLEGFAESTGNVKLIESCDKVYRAYNKVVEETGILPKPGGKARPT